MKYLNETIFDIEDLCFIKKTLIKSKEDKIKSSPFFRDGFTMEDYLIKKINRFLEKKWRRAMKKNRIYIAGPMTGLPNYNFEAFDNAERILKARGLEPMNPANIGRKWLIDNNHREPNESEHQDLLRQGKELLNQCSMIYLLRGWEKSRGAKIELRHALNLGLKIELEESYEI